MRRFAILALSALTLAACSEKNDPTALRSSHNILIPGNDSECGVVDYASCYQKLDFQFKILYERNNYLSRRGESEYNLASNTNYELAQVYLDQGITQAAALRHLDAFIKDVTAGSNDGRYSACAAPQILAFANWLRAKVANADLNLTGAPGWDCNVSPLSNFTGTGNVTSGVTLTARDAYHFSNGPYGDTTFTYFSVDRQEGSTWVNVITTPIAPEALAATTPATTIRTFTDAATKLPGTYTYRVAQCDARLAAVLPACSTPVTTTVTIADPNGPPPPPPAICANHDNSNKDPIANNNRDQDKCPKDPPGQTKKS